MAHRISFNRISYHNFMSFANQEWEISAQGSMFLIFGINKDLELDASSVSASNGSGKSNLIQGIFYGLYGQFPYKIHNGNIVNKYSKEPDQDNYIMRVTLDFSVSDGNATTNYRIVRGALKGSAATIRLSLFEESGGNWKDISKSSSANTQDYIDNLLKIDIQSFQRIVMITFDQSFNFYKMGAAQKREFIESMFDTGVYSDMWDLVKKDRSRFSMALQGEKVKLNTLMGQLKNCENSIREYMNTAKSKVAEAEKEIETLKKSSKGDIEGKKKTESDLVAELEKKSSELATELDALNQKADKAKMFLRSAEQKIQSLDAVISSSKREIGKHNDILSILCDDCCGKVRAKYGISEYEATIADSESERGKYEDSSKKIRDGLTGLNKKITEVRDRKLKNDASVRDAKNRLLNIQLEERGILTKIAELTRKCEEMRAGIDNPNNIPMVSTYKGLKTDIAGCEVAIAEKETECKRLDICEKVVSPETIREYIVSRVVDSINKLINKYLEDFNIAIRCELDNHLDKYSIYGPRGVEFEYNNFSMGEQMKLLLATQMAFRNFLMLHLNLSCNILVLDEIVDQNFDTLSISRILDKLLQIAHDDNLKIYIISHRSEVTGLVDDLVEIKPELGAEIHKLLILKKDDISRLMPEEKQ